MNRSTLVALAAALVFAASAPAAQIYFLLGDHADGALYKAAPGPDTAYGLRLDDQGGTYSAGTNLLGHGGPLYLTYNDTDLTQGARIFGLVDRNSDAGEGVDFLVEYAITGLSAWNGGWRADGGSGTATEQGACVVCEVLNLTGLQGSAGEANGYAFIWNNDGHRLAGDSTSWVGRGWLNGTGTNDWLVTGVPTPPPPGEEVPEPATVSLMLLGLGALVARRKYGKKA